MLRLWLMKFCSLVLRPGCLGMYHAASIFELGISTGLVAKNVLSFLALVPRPQRLSRGMKKEKPEIHRIESLLVNLGTCNGGELFWVLGTGSFTTYLLCMVNLEVPSSKGRVWVNTPKYDISWGTEQQPGWTDPSVVDSPSTGTQPCARSCRWSLVFSLPAPASTQRLPWLWEQRFCLPSWTIRWLICRQERDG